MQKFRATRDGGSRICKDGSMPFVAAAAYAALHQGAKRIYLRDLSLPGTVVTLVGFPAEATTTNSIGQEIEPPSWLPGCLRFINKEN